jgi:flagellar export protein FliJ
MEKKAQRDLVAVKNESMATEEKIKKLAGIRIENLTECRDKTIRGLNVPMYKIYQTFLSKLDHDLEKANMGLRKEKEKIKAQEKRLKRESIKKRALETLKDLHLQNFKKNMEQEEQNFLDEMITIRKGGKA